MKLSNLYVTNEKCEDDYELTTKETDYSLEEYIENMAGGGDYYVPNSLELFYHKLEVGIHHCTRILIDEFEDRASDDLIQELLDGKKDLYETLEELLHEIAIELIQQEFEYMLSNAKSVKRGWR